MASTKHSEKNEEAEAEAMPTNEETALVVQDPMDVSVVLGEAAEIFPVLAVSASELIRDIYEGLGNEPLSPAALETVNIPLGGGRTFHIPAFNAEDLEDVPTIDGIIVAHHPIRLFWEGGYTGEATPPVCSSPNARQGVGRYEYGSAENPSGMCASCPKSQWGTGSNGRGTACRLKHVIYMLLPGRRFPVRLILPPTSLKKSDSTGFPAYCINVINHGETLPTIVTRIGLRQENIGTSSSKYSITTFKVSPTKLTNDEKLRSRAYAEAMQSMLVPAAVVIDENPEAERAF